MSHSHGTHSADAAHDSHHGPEAIRKAVRTYIVVFIVLAGLTAVTVAISYVHLPTVQAITLAVVVAATKATLVALFFMHLIDERKVIYWTLALCGFFFLLVLLLPIVTDREMVGWAGSRAIGS